MADILGSQACMESLRDDVEDLQWTITDVLSRSGPLDYKSWKFPDRSSSELNIDELLDMYQYIEEEVEDNQVAHIALYELVIDRLVFLLQAMDRFMDRLVTNVKDGRETVSHTSSIGLVVKKYWNKIIQLNTVVQQIESDNKTKTRKLTDMENSNLNNHVSDIAEKESIVSPCSSTFSCGSVSKIKPFMISRDEYSKSCQTFETAFIPCESCHEVQKNLRNAGDFIISTCQGQGLPSSLVKFKSQISSLEWFSANEISRWTVEQNKDVSRLGKHFEKMSQTNDSLTSDIETQTNKCKSFENKIKNLAKDLKLEKDTHSAQQRQFDVKLKSVEGKHTEDMKRVLMEKDRIILDKNQLESELGTQKCLLEEWQHRLKELEISKENLQRELEERIRNGEEIRKIEKQMENLKAERETVLEQLNNTTLELNKEKVKNKTYTTQTKSLQSKQGPLLERIDELDRENVELKEELATLEEEKENLEEELEKNKTEKIKLNEKIEENEKLIDNLNNEIENLEEKISQSEDDISGLNRKLEEAKERERLIVEYPDINGPVNPNINGSGDIIQDIESQIEANTIRIQLLDEQNSGLRHSVNKLLNVTQHSRPSDGNQEKFFEPVALWKTDTFEKMNTATRDAPYSHPQISQPHSQGITVGHRDVPTPTMKSQHRQATDHDGRKGKLKTNMFVDIPPADRNETFVVGQARPSSGRKKSSPAPDRLGSRPSSAKSNIPANATPIGAYLQMKKSDFHKHAQSTDTGGRPPSGKISQQSNFTDSTRRPPSGKMLQHSDKNDRSQISFTCEKCDKLYHRERDLEIHKTYCEG